MVVAAGTVDGQAEKCLTGGGHNVIKLVVAVLQPVGRLVIPKPQPVIAGCNQAVGGRLGQFITGKLLNHELVIGLVVVEGPDHIVAIPPGVRLVAVPLKAVGVGIANQIEPVPGPLLTVVGRVKQPVDHPFPGSGRGVCEKFCQVLLRRR